MARPTTSSGPAGAVAQVERLQGIQRLALARGKLLRRQQIGDRRARIAQAGPLEGGGQKTVAVIGRAAQRAGFEQQDVGGQVAVFRAQPVGHP